MKGQDIIDRAHEYLDTPYFHQGRVMGVGIDCIGLPICVCQDLGLSEFDVQGYSEFPDGEYLLEQIKVQCQATENPQVGDLLVFKIESDPQHVAILSQKDGRQTMIHAYMGCDRVKEHTYTQWWKDRLVGSFVLPGVTHG